MLNFVESVIKSISEVLKDLTVKPSIILKSTVVPGTAINTVKPILEKNGNQEGLDYNLLSNPEFLREGSAINDTIYPHVIVIGRENLESGKNCYNFTKKFIVKNKNLLRQIIQLLK